MTSNTLQSKEVESISLTPEDQAYYKARLKSNLMTIVMLLVGTTVFLIAYFFNKNMPNSDYFFILPAVFTGCLTLFAITVRFDIKGFADSSPLKEVEVYNI